MQGFNMPYPDLHLSDFAQYLAGTYYGQDGKVSPVYWARFQEVCSYFTLNLGQVVSIGSSGDHGITFGAAHVYCLKNDLAIPSKLETSRILLEVEKFKRERQAEELKALYARFSEYTPRGENIERTTIIEGIREERKSGGSQESTDWLQNAYRDAGNPKPVEGLRKIIERLNEELKNGTHTGPFLPPRDGEDGFRYDTAKGPTLLTKSQLHGRIKKYYQAQRKGER